MLVQDKDDGHGGKAGPGKSRARARKSFGDSAKSKNCLFGMVSAEKRTRIPAGHFSNARTYAGITRRGVVPRLRDFGPQYKYSNPYVAKVGPDTGRGRHSPRSRVCLMPRRLFFFSVFQGPRTMVGISKKEVFKASLGRTRLILTVGPYAGDPTGEALKLSLRQRVRPCAEPAAGRDSRTKTGKSMHNNGWKSPSLYAARKK